MEASTERGEEDGLEERVKAGGGPALAPVAGNTYEGKCVSVEEGGGGTASAECLGTQLAALG